MPTYTDPVKRSWLQPPFWVMVLLLVVSLTALAVLQYRWLDRVRTADRQQREALLAEAGQRFADDLDREVSRALLCFSATGRGAVEESLVAGLDCWQTTAADIDLLAEVYSLSRDAAGLWQLARWRAETARLEPTAAPRELAPLLARLSVPPAGRAGGERISVLMSDVPGILVPWRPIRRRTRFQPPARSGELDSDGGGGFLVARFDREVLLEEFLPALARRYFAGRGGGVYRLELFDSRGERLFAAGPELTLTGRTGGLPRADLEIDMFGSLPAEGLRDLAVQLHRWRPGDGERDPARRGPGRREEVRRSLSALALTGAAVSPGGWRLAVTHASGSLDHAVTGAMRRSLVVGLGTLGLLAGSVLLLAGSARRSRRLARQQLDFVAGVTHELMTPLAAVRSAGQNLADGVVAEPAQVRRYGTLIESEGRRLSGMVSEILDLSGVQSGRKSYSLSPTSLARVVASALESSRPALEQTGFEVAVDLDEDLPSVLADEEALRRVFENLIGNALKYAAEGRWLGVRSRVRGDGVEVAIEDRGPGVPAAEQDRIFEPFARGRELAGSNVPGSGLGLSLARHVVEAHRGTLRVESRPGAGSTFVVFLPAAAERVADGVEA